MALATNALTTLEMVKKNLSGNMIELDDDLIIQKINEASEFIENHTRRKFKLQVITEKFIGDGRQYISLKNYPVKQITSVTESGTLIDESEYDIEPDYGLVYKDTGWSKGKGKNIVVQYQAGYVLPRDEAVGNPRTLPYDLEGACIVMATIKYQNRDSEGLTERRVGVDFTEKYLNDIPTSIKLVIDLYKRRG